MTFKKFFPVSLMIGLVAAIYIFVGLKLQFSALWAPFISWPLYFIAGAKPSRLHKEIIGLIGGVIFGFVTIWANGLISPFFVSMSAAYGGMISLSVVVFFVAFIIVALEMTNWFELAPAYFFAFAGYFAYVFGGFAGKLVNTLDYAGAMVPFILLLMLGLGLGYITALIRRKILEKEGLFGSQQKTVFDKEKEAM